MDVLVYIAAPTLWKDGCASSGAHTKTLLVHSNYYRMEVSRKLEVQRECFDEQFTLKFLSRIKFHMLMMEIFLLSLIEFHVMTITLAHDIRNDVSQCQPRL